jgi:hypothetical protein
MVRRRLDEGDRAPRRAGKSIGTVRLLLVVSLPSFRKIRKLLKCDLAVLEISMTPLIASSFRIISNSFLIGRCYRGAPSGNRTEPPSGEKRFFLPAQPFDGQAEAVLHAADSFGQLPYLVAR